MSQAQRWFLPFRFWSLASKVSGIAMFTTLAGVLLCYVTFAIIELRVTLNESRAQVTSVARMIAVGAGAALTFRDEGGAGDALAAIRDNPEIVAARVLLPSGDALARYDRGASDATAVANPWLLDRVLARLRVSATVPVEVSGETVGTVVLTADLAAVWRGLVTKLALSAVAVGLVLLLIALPLSRRLQRLISEPVIDLSSTARRITREGDYTIRARRHGNDEVGTLIDCFNAMLDRIQARDAEIDSQNQRLESRVLERTRDLDQIRERFVMALDASNLALWDCNGETGEVYVSDAGPLRGGTRGVKIDSSVTTLLENLHPDDMARARETFRNAMRGKIEVIDIETRMRRDDGDWQWIHLIGRIIERGPTGRAVRLLGTLENVTARRANQAALQRAKEAAEAASRAKSQLLANMSHEIRTPMNGVLGVTGLLLDTPLSERQRELARTVERSAEHLENVINDILDFSKIEAGRMTLVHTAFDLSAAIDDTVQVFAEQAHAKGLALACAIAPEVPRRLIADPVRVRQILTNLIGNAVKFTRDGEVIVSVTTIGSEGTSIRLAFEVRDTGVGIPEDAQRRIFDAFSQADETTTRRFGGTGLGLSIVRQLAELMGGGVSIESAPGAGSAFRFTILAEVDRETASPPPLHRRLPRVLVVDDNLTNRQIIEHQCVSAGLTVESAEDGPSALTILRSTSVPPDLVILDDHMPGMRGLEVARAIRTDTNPHVAGMRILMLSSGGDSPAPEESSRLKIDAWLRKPVRREALLRCIVPTGSIARGAAFANANVATPESATLAVDILLVEDNPVNQLVAREMLAALGCSVTVAKDGYECLDALAQRAYDCVLMDCQMPGMDGYTATREWRLRESSSDRPRQLIVALTANAVEGDREQCIAAGMDDYLPKPFKRDQLQAMIARNLSVRRHAKDMVSTALQFAAPAAAKLPTTTVDASNHRGHHAEL